MRLLFLAAAGGALGAGSRHLINIGCARLLGSGFPWGTLVVNVVGSFAMAALIEAFALKFGGSLELRTFLATGVLGGFTTFSAYSLDFATLLARKEHVLAGLYLGGSVLLAILAFYAGLAVVRALLT